MPLPAAKPRQLQHRRTITSEGFLREDGLWDIEARMQDVKSYDSELIDRGHLPAGTAFHDISMRLTIDRGLLIHEVEASIDSSPFTMCPQIAPNFKQLCGLRIGPGWRSEVAARVGGTQGCTHLNELLPVLATTAFQTLWSNPNDSESKDGVKAVLNTCHTWSEDSLMIKKYLPEFYHSKKVSE